MRLLAAALFCLAARPAAAQEADDFAAFAHCIGQGDAYAEAAADYGYDRAAADAAADRRFLALTAAAPDRAETLAEARAAGLKDWRTRAAAVQADPTGTAYDDHVAAAFACDDIRDRLAAAGLRPD